MTWTGTRIDVPFIETAVPLSSFLMLGMFAIMWYILKYTAWGRHIYATGDDPESSRLIGIKVDRVLLAVYGVAGLIYAVGGWFLLGRLGAASPQAGQDANLDTITAVVIGGTSLFGGRGTVIGTLARRHHRGRGSQRIGHLTVHHRRGFDQVRPALAGLHDRRARHRVRRARPVDPEGEQLTAVASNADIRPVLQAKDLVKNYGRVVALDRANLELYPGEVLGVIGDNGAGKSTLIKCFSGAVIPDSGEIYIDGEPVDLHVARATRRPPASRPSTRPWRSVRRWTSAPTCTWAASVASRASSARYLRMLDLGGMREAARQEMSDLGLLTIQDMGQAVETLSGGQRQGVAVARAAAFGQRVIIMDEPTAALGVKESPKVLQLIRDVRDRGIPVILISHNMPHVFDVADRIHIHRLGRRVAVVTPESHSMAEAVAIMTGAIESGHDRGGDVASQAEHGRPGPRRARGRRRPHDQQPASGLNVRSDVLAARPALLADGLFGEAC